MRRAFQFRCPVCRKRMALLRVVSSYVTDASWRCTGCNSLLVRSDGAIAMWLLLSLVLVPLVPICLVGLSASAPAVWIFVVVGVVVIPAVAALASYSGLDQILVKHETGRRCHNCAYDLRGTPDRCPECRHVPGEPPQQRSEIGQPRV